MSRFEGFPPELFDFFAALERDNSKAFWQTRRDIWQSKVQVPMLKMLEELTADFGPLRMFRPNRDTRFSKDKSPYKLWTGATSESQAVGGIGYYFSLSATTMTVGYGAMAMDGVQANAFRRAVQNDRSGSAFLEILKWSAGEGFPVTGGLEPPLQRVPPGFQKDHPRADLFRWKGAGIIQEDERAEWMNGPAAIEHVRRVWTVAQPLKTWLDSNIPEVELR